jgi:hypothetical protein
MMHMLQRVIEEVKKQGERTDSVFKIILRKMEQ